MQYAGRMHVSMQSSVEDPTFADVGAWHLVTPDIRGVQEDEETTEDADWIREMTAETERVLVDTEELARPCTR